MLSAASISSRSSKAIKSPSPSQVGGWISIWKSISSRKWRAPSVTTRFPSARLFEIGSTFHLDTAGKIIEQRKLAIVGSPDPHELRGTIETLLNKLDPDKPLRIAPENSPGFTPGGAGSITWGAQTVGRLG